MSGTNALSVFEMSRRVKAPRDLVWQAWTDEGQLEDWFGPHGSTMSHSRVDLRVGGTFHYCMTVPGMGVLWGIFQYQEITAPERLIYLSGFFDPEGAFARAPFADNWPLETLNVVMFTDLGDETEIILRAEPHNATAEEQQIFAMSIPAMQGGWSGTFERLHTYLEQ